MNVTVNAGGAASNTISVPVATAAPGLFALPDGAAIVQNFPDYSLNDPSNPAKAGSTIIAYLTGSGPVSPAVADGAISPASPANATAVSDRQNRRLPRPPFPSPVSLPVSSVSCR